MSREILFRAKRVDNGEWAVGDLLHSGEKCYIKPQANAFRVDGTLTRLVVVHEVVPETIGQFTGLTDKNGTKVFEGDIVIFNKNRHLPNTKCVPQAIFYDERNVQFTRYESPYATLQKDMMQECEVIGNIYDNPELLEE